MAARSAEADESTPLLDGQPDGRGASTGASTSSSHVDAAEIDVRFKRWIDHVTRKRKAAQVSPLEREAQFLISVFGPLEADKELVRRGRQPSRWPDCDGYLGQEDFERQMTFVRGSIAEGLQPKMIQTGSSGSYFVRSYMYEQVDGGGRRRLEEVKVVAVFKPHDEEPYGDFNPKRVLLRRYLWWAMGRPCLIPSFSYLSEVGASLLDSRLKLGIVPSTRLVSLASESFSYPQSMRRKDRFAEKPGSYQQFLRGYVNASTFLRAHPWPSRPRSLLERDLQAENTAHGRAKARARKGRGKADRKSIMRKCLSSLASLNCLAPIGLKPSAERSDGDVEPSTVEDTRLDFQWTKELMDDFRLELEKLVCFDYLIRNTDRGLDNFMVKIVEPSSDQTVDRRRLVLAAIDNSLAFPWKHPAGIRSYPWGWLYLPTDLIGGPFSPQTRAAFLPYLSDPSWWHSTRTELEQLFRQDDHFDAKKFEGQMQVLRGQGWNLLESLRNDDEGPLELCARQKRLVGQRSEIVEVDSLADQEGSPHPLTPEAMAIKARLAAQYTAHEQERSAASIPVTMRADVPNPASTTDVLHPRSLPETTDEQDGGSAKRWGIHSAIDDVSSKAGRDGTPSLRTPTAEEQNHGNATLGRAYRRGSLGIDVLAEIDRSTSKARRPNLRKSITRGVSATRLPPRKPTRLASFAGKGRETDNVEGTSGEGDPIDRELVASVASLDSPSSTRQNSRQTSRRRMGSVSDSWSIAGALQIGTAETAQVQTKAKVKVVIEVRQFTASSTGNHVPDFI